jgi:mannitol/fructose-specific phosphotransferase system IIA component (Ntr-type)
VALGDVVLPAEARCPSCGTLLWLPRHVQGTTRANFAVPVFDLPDLTGLDKEQAIRAILAHLVAINQVAPEAQEALVARLLRRERLGPTGIGKGLALPHSYERDVEKPIGALARLSKGMNWGSVDGEPVYTICLFILPYRNYPILCTVASAVEQLRPGSS